LTLSDSICLQGPSQAFEAVFITLFLGEKQTASSRFYHAFFYILWICNVTVHNYWEISNWAPASSDLTNSIAYYILRDGMVVYWAGLVLHIFVHAKSSDLILLNETLMKGWQPNSSNDKKIQCCAQSNHHTPESGFSYSHFFFIRNLA
jgi:hypothetical protein